MDPAEREAAEQEMLREMQRAENMAQAVERAMGLFIIHPERRESLEGVIIKGQRAEVWFLRPLDVSAESAKCDAYRWLLLGRKAGATGIGPVFKSYPELEQVTLVFYKVETEVKTDGRGGYRQSRAAVRHLEITLSRERSSALDPKGISRTLSGERQACIESGQKLVDHHWYIR